MERSSPVNLLLVEDGEIEVLNVKRAYRNSQGVASIHVARNGEDALALLRSGEVPFDRLLVLLDLNMPRMNGIEFLRHVRADEALRALPVVVLSTSDDERDRIDAYGYNVAGYLLKPVTRDRFMDCMKRLEEYWSRMVFP